MQKYKKWVKNQLECEETGLFLPFLQMESHRKVKKFVYFLSNKLYRKTNNQYFLYKKTGKHQSFTVVVRQCSKERKKGEFLRRRGERK